MKYNPHPAHQLIPFAIMLFMAFLAMIFPGWIMIVAFLVTCVMAIIVSLWIGWAGKVREETDYWFWIGEDIKKLENTKPEIWHALGFVSPPEYVKIEHVKTNSEEHDNADNPFYSVEFMEMKISPAILQVFANGVLSGKPMSETEWCGDGKPFGSTRFRRFKKWMEVHNLITQVHTDAATQGFILTELGEQWLLQYASEGIKKTYRTHVVATTPESPPTE